MRHTISFAANISADLNATENLWPEQREENREEHMHTPKHIKELEMFWWSGPKTPNLLDLKAVVPEDLLSGFISNQNRTSLFQLIEKNLRQ